MSTRLLYIALLGLLCILLSCQPEAPLVDSLLVKATQAFRQDNLPLAETLFTQVIQETMTSGLPDERTALALYHLGEIYRLQEKWDLAEKQLWRALPIWAKTVGPLHPSMAKGLTSLAQVFEARQEYTKSESLIKQALKIREIAYGQDHPKIVKTLDQYAALLNRMDRTEEAEIYLSRGRTIRKKHPSQGGLKENS